MFSSEGMEATGIRSFSEVHQGPQTHRSLIEQLAFSVNLPDLDQERSGAVAQSTPARGSFLSRESGLPEKHSRALQCAIALLERRSSLACRKRPNVVVRMLLFWRQR